MRHLFLDTNVIIDLLADRKPFSESSSKLFDYAEKGKINLYISALSYSNIYYIVRKICSHKQMLAMLRELEAMTTTVDVTKQIIATALHSSFKDYEDAIQYNTALSNKKIEAIITRNPRDFKNNEMPVFTPKEALGTIESAKNAIG
jgi:predicted nucleic acid-binding protein